MTSIGIFILLALVQFCDLTISFNTNIVQYEHVKSTHSLKFSNINERIQLQVSGSINSLSETNEIENTDNKSNFEPFNVNANNF